MGYWTASKIASANYCGMRWWLEYVEHAPRERFSYYEKGEVMHDLIENFWKRLEKNYKNAAEFSKYAQGKWLERVHQAEHSSAPITWRFKDEPWIIKARLGKIAVPLFDWMNSQEKPLFAELSFDFRLDGLNHRGRIDEIRTADGLPLIRDYKSGSPHMGAMRLAYDPQPTEYCLALSALMHSHRTLATKLGLADEASLLMGNGKIISELINFEYVMLEDKDEENNFRITTHKGNRTDRHYHELLLMIRGIEKRHRENAIYPERGYKCDFCPVKIPCDERSRHFPIEQHSGEQRFFDFSKPPLYDLGFAEDIKQKNKQKCFDWTAARKQTEMRQTG